MIEEAVGVSRRIWKGEGEGGQDAWGREEGVGEGGGGDSLHHFSVCRVPTGRAP